MCSHWLVPLPPFPTPQIYCVNRISEWPSLIPFNSLLICEAIHSLSPYIWNNDINSSQPVGVETLTAGSSEVIVTLLQAEPFVVQVCGWKWHFSWNICLGFCAVKSWWRWDKNRFSKHKNYSSYKRSATTKWIHEWNVISASRTVFPGNYHSAWCLSSC